MKETTWLHELLLLKSHGVCTPTADELKLRRVPIESVSTLEAVFQPRVGGGDVSDSGKHLGDLKRILRDTGSLDPITVMKTQTGWLCVDGHHRLEAYRAEQLEGSRRTHLPVKVFSGTPEEAFKESIRANAQAKLNMTQEERLEAGWRLVVLGGDTAGTIGQLTGIGERTVKRMRRALENVKGPHPHVKFETWSWSQVKALLKGEQPMGSREGWEDVQAGEWAKSLAKTFCGLPSQHPRVFAKALLRYNAEAARIIAEEVVSQQTTQDQSRQAAQQFPNSDF